MTFQAQDNSMTIYEAYDFHLQVTDFGSSAHLLTTMERRRTMIGTPHWMSPEVIACHKTTEAGPTNTYDLRADIWSLGEAYLDEFHRAP